VIGHWEVGGVHAHGADVDVELTRAAQAGDVAAVGLLLERNRAGMRAVALSLLGPGPDVDDVLQEAALVALVRLADLRDPTAAGAWLRMIVRNKCRMLLRDSPPTEPLPPSQSTREASPGPEALLEHHAMRDWVWEAVEELPGTLRMPLMLRHFTEGVTSYEHIAAVCGVPVGTVRSRLHQARAKLATALSATADTAHADTRARSADSWDEARNTLTEAQAGNFARVLARRWSPDVALMDGASRMGGARLLTRAMDVDLAAGVRQRPVNVVAGRSIAVWEMDLINPADAPDHCPPSVAWIMTLSGGRVAQLRLFHPRPLNEASLPPDLHLG